MDPTSTPRVSARYLGSYIEKPVIVVGKVIQVRGEEALIDADGQISITLSEVCAAISAKKGGCC